MKASRGFQATPPQLYLLMTTLVAGRGNHTQEQSRIHSTIVWGRVGGSQWVGLVQTQSLELSTAKGPTVASASLRRL